MKKTIKVGSDFSGVGAFDQAISRIEGIEKKTVFACDMDKFARQSYIENYGEPEYYPENVYNREIPSDPLDVYMTSPPCQSFSLAGKRKGKYSENGVLFFNSHEFIKKNNPRFFIFENVKGLLSDDSGKTFSEWCNMLGGKSINGLPILFPYEDSVLYHVYWKVCNSKKHGVPQNRERVFIIGIRDDSDNSFTWPKEEPLLKKLRDVLEKEVDEKYFLSEKILNYMFKHKEIHKQRGNGFSFNVRDINKAASAISTKAGSRQTDNYLKVTSATKSGFETATENDSINFSQPKSETRRGRVGKEVDQTLDTACCQAVIKNGIRRLTPRECFRLQDFPDSFKFVVSNSQLYKQAGNSITCRVLELILRKLPL